MQTIPARQEGDVWVPDIYSRATIVEIHPYRSNTLQTESGRTIHRNVRALRPVLPEQHQQHHDNDSNNLALRVRIRDTQIPVATPPVRASTQPVRAPGQTITRAGRIIVEPRRLNL